MAEVLRCVDRWGREVTLTDTQWLGHILPTHGELRGQLAAIRATIITPTTVRTDARHVHGENFYLLGALAAPFDRTYLKVCVRYTHLVRSALWSGEIVTAYSAASLKRGEVQKWP